MIRTRGLTHVMDKGLNLREIEGLFDTAGEYVDIVKLGWGTSYVTNNLEKKIALYRSFETPVVCGGTLFEAVVARGKLDQGLAHFREALKIEDAGLYFEPPKWYYPIRHSLGATLLKAGQNAEAEAVYREDLKRFPENGWSLFGLAAALRAQGKSAEAAAVDQRFSKAWSAADVRLAASRF